MSWKISCAGIRRLVVIDFKWIDRIGGVGITETFPIEDDLRLSHCRIDHRLVPTYFERMTVNLNPIAVVGKLDRGFPTVIYEDRYAIIHQTVGPCEWTHLNNTESICLVLRCGCDEDSTNQSFIQPPCPSPKLYRARKILQ